MFAEKKEGQKQHAGKKFFRDYFSSYYDSYWESRHIDGDTGGGV